MAHLPRVQVRGVAEPSVHRGLRANLFRVFVYLPIRILATVAVFYLCCIRLVASAEGEVQQTQAFLPRHRPQLRGGRVRRHVLPAFQPRIVHESTARRFLRPFTLPPRGAHETDVDCVLANG